MTSTTTTTNSTPSAELFPPPAEDAAAKAAHKRYEGLVTVRTKAVKGKGAWYWAHLEPLLLRSPTTNLPKAVKLRCSLCDAVFSASNPSRTATEHLKRGTCPKISPHVLPLAMIEFPSGGPSRSGSRPLATSPPRPSLSRDQADRAVALLAEWFHEACGSVSPASLESPKFRAFLGCVGLAVQPAGEFLGQRLDARYREAKAKAEAKINDAVFFQVASVFGDENNLVRFTVNLPNRSSVFHKAVFAGGPVSPKHAEEILRSSVAEISGDSLWKCVGIVSDKYKAKALRNLEVQNQWMVNLPCQLQAITSLIKDFHNELPLLQIVTKNSSKVANFVNSECRVRRLFQKYKENTPLEVLRAPPPKCQSPKSFAPVFAMLEDLLSCSRVLQLITIDDSCKATFSEDPDAGDVARMIRSEAFWNELEAVYSLVNLVTGLAQEIEAERPLIGQCLPLWDELRRKIKDWCHKNSIPESPVEKIIDNRFRKSYHPAMSAAFILDPLNLMRDSSGKYLPPFKCLTNEQEKDVDKLVTRLVSRDEAHVALMELMKWRSDGLDPLYAQAVQMKQRDPVSGKMKIANPQSSRLVWETCLSEFRSLGKVAIRLVFLQATSCGFKCNRSFMKWICVHPNSRVGLERAQKMLFVAAQAKLERRDFSSEEERDVELFNGVEKDAILSEAFADGQSG